MTERVKWGWDLDPQQRRVGPPVGRLSFGCDSARVCRGLTPPYYGRSGRESRPPPLHAHEAARSPRARALVALPQRVREVVRHAKETVTFEGVEGTATWGAEYVLRRIGVGLAAHFAAPGLTLERLGSNRLQAMRAVD